MYVKYIFSIYVSIRVLCMYFITIYTDFFIFFKHIFIILFIYAFIYIFYTFLYMFLYTFYK